MTPDEDPTTGLGTAGSPDVIFADYRGIANALIAAAPATSTVGPIRRRPRLGGVLNYYERAA